MTLNSKNASRLFAIGFFAILTLMLVDGALLALNAHAMREIVHVEALQADQTKDIGSLQVDSEWAHGTINEMHGQIEQMKGPKWKIPTGAVSLYCDHPDVCPITRAQMKFHRKQKAGK